MSAAALQERRRRRRLAWEFYGITAASLLLFVAAWEIAGRLTNPLFFAPFSDVLAEFGKAIVDPRQRLLIGFGQTLSVLIPGYALAALLGTGLGVLMGRNRVVHEIFDPYLTVLYNTPRVALIPIFMMWLGVGDLLKVTVVVVAAIFPILVNTMTGVRDVSAELTEPARSFNISERQLLWKVILPASLPFVVTGLKLALGRALTTVIVAEFFASISGLGGILHMAASSYQMARMFVPALILALMGIVLDAALSWCERLASRRYGR